MHPCITERGSRPRVKGGGIVDQSSVPCCFCRPPAAASTPWTVCCSEPCCWRTWASQCKVTSCIFLHTHVVYCLISLIKSLSITAHVLEKNTWLTFMLNYAYLSIICLIQTSCVIYTYIYILFELKKNKVLLTLVSGREWHLLKQNKWFRGTELNNNLWVFSGTVARIDEAAAWKVWETSWAEKS